jgi:hypothetical protein
VGLFDWLRRKPPEPVVWRIYLDGGDLVADNGKATFKVPRARARAVRIVPPGGHQQGAGGTPGYQVAVACVDSDIPVGKPTLDWRPARELADQLCTTAELPLDELTERMFSRIGTIN